MKGFTKDGKFRPTGNKSKSSLKKTDLKKRNKESFCNSCGSRLQTGQACKTCQAIKNIQQTPEFKSGMSGSDVAQHYRSQGKATDLGLEYKKTLDKNRNKESFSSEECTRCKGQGTRNGVAFCYRCMGTGQKKRSKVTLQEGLHRPQRTDGNFTPLTKEQKQENIDALLEDTDPIYMAMVEKYPNSSVGSDIDRWASSGLYGSHGGFGEKLREGDIVGAMYHSDLDNLEHLGELHIENMLSNVQHHPDDPSDRAEFLSRLEYASGRTHEQRDYPLGRPTV